MSLTRILITGALGLAALPVLAHTYPTRPIRVIVPSDILARPLQQKANAAHGQQLVVDNRPGAASRPGTALAARGRVTGDI